MTRRTLVYCVVGLAIGAAFGWWFDQLPTEAALGLAAGALLSFTRVGRSRGG